MRVWHTNELYIYKKFKLKIRSIKSEIRFYLKKVY